MPELGVWKDTAGSLVLDVSELLLLRGAPCADRAPSVWVLFMSLTLSSKPH